MAIEDAFVLAHCLERSKDVDNALVDYQKLRFSRTARVTNISRVYGVIGQWENGAACRIRNKIFQAMGNSKNAAKQYLKFVNCNPLQA